jgi:hypothetical protein
VHPAGQSQDVDGRLYRVEADREIGIGGRQLFDKDARSKTEDGYRKHQGAEPRYPPVATRNNQATGDGAEEDREEGRHGDQCVAADQGLVVEQFGQDRVFCGAKKGRLHTH